MLNCSCVDFRDTFDNTPPSREEINRLRLWYHKECGKWVSLIGGSRCKDGAKQAAGMPTELFRYEV